MKAHPTHTPARAIPAPMASAGPMAAAPPVATVFAAMAGFVAAATLKATAFVTVFTVTVALAAVTVGTAIVAVVTVFAAARDLAVAIVFAATAAPVSTKDRRGVEIVACTTCLVHAFRTSPRPSLLRLKRKHQCLSSGNQETGLSQPSAHLRPLR